MGRSAYGAPGHGLGYFATQFVELVTNGRKSYCGSSLGGGAEVTEDDGLDAPRRLGELLAAADVYLAGEEPVALDAVALDGALVVDDDEPLEVDDAPVAAEIVAEIELEIDDDLPEISTDA